MERFTEENGWFAWTVYLVTGLDDTPYHEGVEWALVNTREKCVERISEFADYGNLQELDLRAERVFVREVAPPPPGEEVDRGNSLLLEGHVEGEFYDGGRGVGIEGIDTAYMLVGLKEDGGISIQDGAGAQREIGVGGSFEGRVYAGGSWRVFSRERPRSDSGEDSELCGSGGSDGEGEVDCFEDIVLYFIGGSTPDLPELPESHKVAYCEECGAFLSFPGDADEAPCHPDRCVRDGNRIRHPQF